MKKYLTIIFLCLICILPSSVYAYELICDTNTHYHNDSFSCVLTGDIKEYDTFSGSIETEDILSCERSSIAAGLIAKETTTDNYFDLYGIPESDQLINYTCKVTRDVSSAENTQISISNFKYHIVGTANKNTSEILRSDYLKIDKKKEEVVTDTKPRETSNPDLQLDKLSSPELDFIFSKFISIYNVEVLYEVDKINLDYKVNNPTSTVRIEGSTNLSVGKNVIDIYVISADGLKSNCYTLNVTRLARGEEIYYPEKDATLSSLTVTGYSIKFDKAIYEYSLHLGAATSSVTVNAKATYDKAIISVSETDNLKNGSKITILVTSADESETKEYVIHITKDAPKKDYTTVIIIGVLVLALTGTIVSFIMTSQRKKSDDPILKLKKDKRKVNKGKKFDDSAVPEANNNEQLMSNTNEEINTTVIADQPTPTENLTNVVTPVEPTIEAQPQIEQVQSAPVVEQPQVVETVQQQPVQEIQPVQPVQPAIEQVQQVVEPMQPQVQVIQPQTVEQPQMVQTIPTQPVGQVIPQQQMVEQTPIQPQIQATNTVVAPSVEVPQNPINQNINQ